MEGTIGEIRMFAATFAPKSWNYCDGSIINIKSNTALYSIIGTTYGGDGVNTFALPDLRSRTAMGAGQGPGLSYYALGQKSGAAGITLTEANLPPHTHGATTSISVPASSEGGSITTPSGSILAAKAKQYSNEADVALKAFTSPLSMYPAGGSSSIPLAQPALGMNYIICMFGVFPSRN